MAKTRLSSKGQVIIPKAVRDAHGWQAGMVLDVQEHQDGVLLRPRRLFPETTIDEVAGCIKWSGKPLSLADMENAVLAEARRRGGK